MSFCVTGSTTDDVCVFSAERSQDSEVVMLSDSNSTQDAFTDPTSSQDSSHKPTCGKAGSSSSESTTPVKDGQSMPEDMGTICPVLLCLTVDPTTFIPGMKRFLWLCTVCVSTTT